MLREIINSSGPVFTIRLPQDMIGKTLEVIAFEINAMPTPITNASLEREKRLRDIEEITKKSLVDLSNFKFSRDDANNYEA